MKVRMTVKAGECRGKVHKIGQEFTFEHTTPGAMCLGAWNAIAPYLITLSCGGNFPWEKEKGVATIRCPDPDAGILLELRRIEEGDEWTSATLHNE